jgi:hypothetical protein
MDQVIWIEALARREVVLRQRVRGAVVTIGRAYDNDIVLDDPHVAAHHLRLQRGEDGGWSAEDLGSLNGAFVNGARRDLALLDERTTVQIGQTGIRLRPAAFEVPPELPLERARPRWPLALICLAALSGLLALLMWLNETGEPKLSAYLALPIEVGVAVAAWAAVWGVLARIFTGRAQYARHLLIASAGLLALVLFQPLAQLGAFALSLPALAGYDFVAVWLVLATVCFFHQRAFGRSRLALKAAGMLLLAALGIGIQFLSMADDRSRNNQPATALLETLLPPNLRLAQPQAQTAFFAAAAGLQTALDASRAQDPPEDGEDEGEGD